MELDSLLQLCPELPMLPSALRASSSGAADAEQARHIHHSQFLQMKHFFCSLSFPGHRQESWGWSLLTWHCM